LLDVISFGVLSVSHQGNREKQQQPDQGIFVLVLYDGL
jgi:hypothetical protein